MSVNLPLLFAVAMHHNNVYTAASVSDTVVQLNSYTKRFIAAFQRDDGNFQVVAQSANEKFIKKLITTYNTGEKAKATAYFIKHSNDISYDILFNDAIEKPWNNVPLKFASHIACCVYPPNEERISISTVAYEFMLLSKSSHQEKTDDITKRFRSLVEQLLNIPATDH